MTMDIVILTKSTMKGGYCVSGIDVQSHEWIRLVADSTGSPLNDRLMTCIDEEGMSKHCEPLDVVRVDVETVPLLNHTENCRVKDSADVVMRRLGTMTLDDVVQLLPSETHEYVYGNSAESLSEDEMRGFGFKYSLMMIRVKNLSLRTNKADFDYNGIHYRNMSVTDPYYHGFSAGLGDAYIVVSMPSAPDRRSKRYYKLIAKIFPLK